MGKRLRIAFFLVSIFPNNALFPATSGKQSSHSMYVLICYAGVFVHFCQGNGFEKKVLDSGGGCSIS